MAVWKGLGLREEGSRRRIGDATELGGLRELGGWRIGISWGRRIGEAGQGGHVRRRERTSGKSATEGAGDQEAGQEDSAVARAGKTVPVQG